MLFWICLSIGCFVENWPEFRGPKANGHVEGIATPMEWSDTKNVAWKTPIPGLGWSSPVVSDGRIYLTTAVPDGEGLVLRVLSLNAESGDVIWDREIRRIASVPSIHKKNSHASPTPILRGNAVFVHFGPLGMARLTTDGTIVWTNFEFDYPHVHGSGGSPYYYDNKLIVICDGSTDPFVAAINADTGKIDWKQKRSMKGPISHSFGTPIVTEVGGKPQILAPGPDHFASYDLRTGEELWRVKAPGWSVVPQPVLGNGVVYYNHDYDHPELMAVRLDGKGDVTDSNVVWRIQRGAPSTPTPVLVGNELYFVSDTGIASCVDAKTGERHWMERLGGNYSASPIFANGNILFLDEDGHATWIKPSAQYTVLAKNEVSGRTFATPAFVDGAMYLRTDELLMKISR